MVVERKSARSEDSIMLNTSNKLTLLENEKGFFSDIQSLIEKTRSLSFQTINSSLIMLNWHIGKRINDQLLKQSRAEYGEELIDKLSKYLISEYGRGFSRDNLFRMVRFSKAFPESEIVATLSQQLSWSHWAEILLLKNELQRSFYIELCHIEKWSIRTLRKNIQGMLFERTALSKNTETFIKEELAKVKQKGELSPAMVLRDPYFIDWLKLPKGFSEKNLEEAILEELPAFIQELGNDFCFIERQKRMTIGGEDFYLDLLMFHRGLRRLIAIELKLGKFSPANKGQMEFYLRWLDKYERKKGEEPPLGIILCAEKNQEQVELLDMNQSGIHVAEYLTELPAKGLLEHKLHQAIIAARERLGDNALLNAEQDELGE